MSKLLRLGRGIRVQHEKSSQSYLLLFPEGIVDLSPSAYEIMSRLPEEREKLHDELCKIFSAQKPLDGFDEFIDSSIKARWIHVEKGK